MNAPDLFELDDDDKVVILKESISEEERAHAEEAVRACPVDALVLEAE
jgi:ferredoxin